MGFLPPSTNAEYRGHPAAAWFLTLCSVLTIGPGLIHSFAPAGGAIAIAGLELGDQAQLVRGLFAWQGATQIAFGLALLAVAHRYRPLVPLFLVLLAVERGLISLQGWVLLPSSGGHHPPEHYASPVSVVLALGFLVLALRPRT
jgi:hypothetical protein